MRQYKFSLTISEGKDEFWEDEPSDKQVAELVEIALAQVGQYVGINCELELVKVADKTKKRKKASAVRGRIETMNNPNISNNLTSFLLWLFMMTTLTAGVVIGYSFSIPGGDKIGVIIFIFVATMLWIVTTSKRRKIK